MQTVTGPDGAQRIPPGMAAGAYTTFHALSPRRPATCEETGCENYLNGWVTVVDAGKVPLVRGLSGRYSFTEKLIEGGLHEFTFGPGQVCFLGAAGKHSLPWDGRERFLQRGGDWRGNPRGDRREFTRPDDWVDQFANHQIRLAERLGRG
jgi:hypothetical protein